MQELEELLKIIVAIQGILVIAFILQLIANLVIIFQLPQIKKYIKLVFEKMYGFEEEEEIYEENDEKINALKMVYANKEVENSVEDEVVEKTMESLDKETIEIIIAITLVGIFAILLLLHIIN